MPYRYQYGQFVHEAQIHAVFRDPVIKARPDGKQQITAADCHIGCISAVHPQISDKQRMICRNGASPHDRCHYRHLCFSTTSVNNALARAIFTPPPARNSGRFAL